MFKLQKRAKSLRIFRRYVLTDRAEGFLPLADYYPLFWFPITHIKTNLLRSTFHVTVFRLLRKIHNTKPARWRPKPTREQTKDTTHPKDWGEGQGYLYTWRWSEKWKHKGKEAPLNKTVRQEEGSKTEHEVRIITRGTAEMNELNVEANGRDKENTYRINQNRIK